MYVCIGVKASNYVMPKEVLSDKGPGGGGWTHCNKYMQVVKKPTEGGAVWSDGTVFAVGGCNLGCIGDPPNFSMHPVPKISYHGEEQALHAVQNMKIMAATGEGKGAGDQAVREHVWQLDRDGQPSADQ